MFIYNTFIQHVQEYLRGVLRPGESKSWNFDEVTGDLVHKVKGTTFPNAILINCQSQRKVQPSSRLYLKGSFNPLQEEPLRATSSHGK